MNEAQMHKDNCFITLTYDTPHLPPRQSLKVSDFQTFMKNYRRSILPKRIRFYHCGEYGINQDEKKINPDTLRITPGRQVWPVVRTPRVLRCMSRRAKPHRRGWGSDTRRQRHSCSRVIGRRNYEGLWLSGLARTGGSLLTS